MAAVTALDTEILLWIQSTLRNPVITPLIKAVTSLGNHGLFWVLLTLVLLCFKKTRRIGIFCLAAILCEYILGDLILKHLVQRPRPFNAGAGIISLIGAEKGYSFPSGHSGTAFATVGILWRTVPKPYAVCALVLAVVIALSRLYVGVHYPSDVLAGILLGLLTSTAVYHILQKRFRQSTVKS